MKKLICIFISSLLLLCSCAEEVQLPEEAESIQKPASSGAAVLENSAFMLEVAANGNLKITDKATGSTFASVPENAEADEIAQGVNKNRLMSDFLVTLVNSAGGELELSSFDASEAKDGISVVKDGDGIKVWYLYPEQSVMHSVRYTLEDDGFSASVGLCDLTEQLGKISADDWGFKNIAFLPYFSAADSESTGYSVVPDGSGAIIYHNNKKSSYAVYAQEIYGRDPALNLENKTLETKTASFPVFGSVENTRAYAAVIDKGAADATVYAETSGVSTGYNNVYASFAVRRSDSVSRSVSNGYGGNNTLGRTAVSSYVPEDGEFKIRYILLGGEGHSYVSLAKAYRGYLVESGMKPTSGGAELYIGLTGGISDTEYTLGIPHETVVPVTKFERGAEIVSELKSATEADIAVRLRGWQKGGVDTKLPKNSSAEGKLGGNKGLKSLMESGAEVFPELELVYFHKGGNGLNLQSDCVFALSGSAAFVYEYAVNTGDKDLEEEPWRLLSPEAAKKAWSRFGKNGFSAVSLGSIGETVTSEYNQKSPKTRSQTADIYAAIASEAEKSMVVGGNSYALGADYIFAMESEATLYDLEDASIPFYQIALHSLRSYSVPPINLTPNQNRAMLKALETGSALCYNVSGSDIVSIDEAAPYDYLRETIISQTKAAAPVLKAVRDKEITNHTALADEVFLAEYEGGAKVYVNYSDSDVTVDGVDVKAENFVFKEGEA